MDLAEIVLIAVAGLLGFSMFRRALIIRRTTQVDPDSTLWIQATRKAQATLSIVKSLHEENTHTVLIKYPVINGRGDREHVWGVLLALTEDSFTATMENALVEGKPQDEPPFTMSNDNIEDWVVYQPEGSVRGGFTIQAEIAFARAEGKRPAGVLAEFEGKFIDT